MEKLKKEIEELEATIKATLETATAKDNLEQLKAKFELAVLFVFALWLVKVQAVLVAVLFVFVLWLWQVQILLCQVLLLLLLFLV